MPHVACTLVPIALALVLAVPAGAATLKCAPDSAKVGNVCVDLYETSIWRIPPSKTSLVKKVQAGKATLADLTAGGAVQLGCPFAPFSHPEYPANFPPDGNWTTVVGSDPPSPGVYAASIPGVLPSACVTWFQANQACLLSSKRLLTNREWQGAAAGTPDPGTDNGTAECNISTADKPVNTGSRPSCKSSWGVFDMVGNVSEWVADWADRNDNYTECIDWTSQTGIAGGDTSCFGGNGSGASYRLPGALLRGGSWFVGAEAGVFNVVADVYPAYGSYSIGFRCGR